MPGQLGPTMRDLFCDLSMSVMRTMSEVVSICYSLTDSDVHTVLRDALGDAGHCKLACRTFDMHTYVTIKGTSAMMASSMLAAATGGGTKMAEAVAPVSFMASATLAKTGLPRCSVPAFLGFVPPTTFVPVRPCQSRIPSYQHYGGLAHTVLDGLLCVKAACN
jgi:hypothetical protein